MTSTKTEHMDRLATYVGAIHRQTGALSIASETVEKSCWPDQGFEVCQEVATYRFDNGVVVRRTLEQDTFPSAAACAECWITYEVIETGAAGITVTPARKVFENACRESFWLAYHTA